MPEEKKYGMQFWLNVFGLIAIFFTVVGFYVDYRITIAEVRRDVADTKKMAEENHEILEANAELWRDTFKILGSIEQYIEDHP